MSLMLRLVASDRSLPALSIPTAARPLGVFVGRFGSMGIAKILCPSLRGFDVRRIWN